MSTATVTPEIQEFAAGVRAAMADLPADEVDDLTEGLEADLAESLAEDLRRTLPDPVAYAAELRAAAGLPAPTRVLKPGVWSGMAEGWQATRRDVTIAIRRNPALGSALDFLVSLRPTWWIVRAWVALYLVEGFFGSEDSGFLPDGAWWLVLAVFVLVSVQWGRREWLPPGATQLVAVGNVVAVIALLPVVASANAWSSDDGYVEDSYADPGTSAGITFDGTSVLNVFAYGSDGKLLKDVQLFDQDGRALVPHLDPNRDECLDGDCQASPDGTTFAPKELETGATAGNVFPVSLVGTVLNEERGTVSIDPTAVPQPPKAPFIKVPAVRDARQVAKAND